MQTTTAAPEFAGLEEHPVLIVAQHPVLAALLGISVELAGSCPRFPAPDERLEDAISRLRPALVLLDVEHAASGEDETYQCVAQAGSRLVLFGPAWRPDGLARLAERRGVGVFALPAERSVLGALLPSTAGHVAGTQHVRDNGR